MSDNLDTHQPTLLIPKTAAKAQSELLLALRGANYPGGWMNFMESVESLLPDILRHEPHNTEWINRSFIGQLGFKSWQDMVDAPSSVNGLGWSFVEWMEWSHAWSVIKDNHWIRPLPMNSSEIISLENIFKHRGITFPDSLEALERINQEAEIARGKRRTDMLSELKRTEALAIAHTQLVEATGAMKVMVEQLNQANEFIKEMSSKVEGLEGEVERLQAKVNNFSESTRSFTRWEHLKGLLFGTKPF